MSTGSLDLRACESRVTHPDELLWRQISERFVNAGLVSAEGFVGTSDARSEASVVRSARRTAQEAFEHHTRERGHGSAGTWAVTVAEAATVDVDTIDDESCADVDTPGHGYLDLRNLDKAGRKLARAALAAHATERGRQHPTAT